MTSGECYGNGVRMSSSESRSGATPPQAGSTGAGQLRRGMRSVPRPRAADSYSSNSTVMEPSVVLTDSGEPPSPSVATTLWWDLETNFAGPET